MDDLLGGCDGCLDGCGDGCLDFDGCFDGCFGIFGGGGSSSSSPTTSSRAGYIADAVEDAVPDRKDKRQEPESRRRETHECGRKHIKLSRVRLRLTVWPDSESLVDEVVRYGRQELRIFKIGVWGVGVRWHLQWKTYWIIAFCTPDQEVELMQWFKRYKLDQTGIRG